MFPSGVARLQYGQNLYDSIDDAEATLSTESFIVEDNMRDNGLLRGFIIVKEGTTDISNTRHAKFISANHFGHANDTVVGNVHRTEIVNHASTGIREGGEVTINSGDNTLFDVSSGTGVIVDNFTTPINPTLIEVEWDTLTGQTATNLTGDSFSYLTINSNGGLVQTAGSTGLTPQQKRDEILLGGILHIGGQILFAWDRQIPFVSPVNHIEDLTTSIGPFSINGNRISSITGTLSLEKSVGESFYFGGFNVAAPKSPNITTNANLSASTLVYAKGDDIIGPSGTTIDVDNYDPNGAGTVTSISPNSFVPHRIWHQPTENILIFQYGQFEYNNLEDARVNFGLEDFTTPKVILEESYLVAVIICREGENNLDNSARSQVIPQGKFAGTGGGGVTPDTLQSAYDNSVSPEIVIDTTRNAVDFRIGTGTDSDNLVQFQQTDGKTNAYVTGEGYISGSTVDGTSLFENGTNINTIYNTINDFTAHTGNTSIHFTKESLDSRFVNITGDTITGSLVVNGDFTVLGTATTVNTETLKVKDNIITLNSTFTAGTPTLDTGIEALRGSADTAVFLWDETNDYWVAGLTGSTAKVILATDGLGDLASTAHTHPISEVVGLQTELDSKTDNTLFVSHTGNTSLHAHTTGTTLIGTTLYFDRNDVLSAYTADLSSFIDDTNFYVTGGTVIGNNMYLDRNDTLSAVTVDVTSLLDNTDNYTTGTTLIDTTLYFDRTDTLSAYTADLSSFIDNTNYYTTGTSLVGTTLYFDRTDTLSAYTADLSSFIDNTDNFTTGATLIGSIAYFDRTNGLSAYTLDLSTLDVNDTFVTGGTFNVTASTLTMTRNDDVEVVVTGMTGGGIGASVSLSWRFNSSTLTANPGSKKMSLNATIPSGVTEIYFNDFTEGNFDAGAILNALNVGDFIYVQQGDDSTRGSLYTVSASSVDNTGWWTVGVANNSGDAVPLNNKSTGVIFFAAGESSDIFVTSGIYNASTDAITLTRNDAGTIDITGVTDTFVTGGTFTNNQLTLTRNNGGIINTTIDTFTGITVNGQAQIAIISATTISGDTFYGDGSNLTGIVAEAGAATGITVTITAGENLVSGNLVYLNTDGKYYKAHNAGELSASTELRLVTATIAADASGDAISQDRYITTGLTSGSTYWVGTNGTFTDTQPTTNGSIVRYVGTAVNDTILEFNPDALYVEISTNPNVVETQSYRETNVSGSLLSTDWTLNVTSSGNTTQTLPSAIGNTGKVFNIKNSDSTSTGVVTVVTSLGQTIDVLNTATTINYPASLTFQSTGSNWIII
jgi:hypothetical protein